VKAAAWPFGTLLALSVAGPADAGGSAHEPRNEDPAVVAAKEEVARFPQDYGARAGLARALCAAESWLPCSEAWAEASRLSGGNLEATTGRANALREAGRLPEAVAVARAWALLHPDDAGAWLLVGDTLRAPGALDPAWTRPGAAWAYRRASEAARATGALVSEARCRRVEAHLDLGDRLGAVRLAEGEDCGAEPSSRLRARHHLLAGIFGGASGSAGGDGPSWGPQTSLGAAVWFGELLWIGTAARLVRNDVDSGTGPDLGPFFQGEVWGRLGVGHAGQGGELFLAWIDPSDQDGAFAIAGRLWLTLGPTLAMEMATADWEDGRQVQALASLRIPLLRGLWVRGGLGWTQQVSATDAQGEASTFVRPAALVGGIELGASIGPVALSGGVHPGPTRKPITLADAAAWNLPDPVLLQGRVRVDIRPTDLLQISALWDVLRLDGEQGLRDVHSLTLGLTLRADFPERP
jgi:hypothetical protein